MKLLNVSLYFNKLSITFRGRHYSPIPQKKSYKIFWFQTIFRWSNQRRNERVIFTRRLYFGKDQKLVYGDESEIFALNKEFHLTIRVHEAYIKENALLGFILRSEYIERKSKNQILLHFMPCDYALIIR